MDISPIVDGYFGTDQTGSAGALGADGPAASARRRGNFMARPGWRCCTTGRSSWNGLVIGTGNKTEALIGYTTLYGDNASAFNPIGDLYKSQVRQLAAAVGVPDAILRKAPSADLWPGQTDEDEVGFDYASSTGCCSGWSTGGGPTDELVAMGFDAAMVERVERWSPAPSSSARSRRSPSSARGRRAWTTSIRVAGLVRARPG